MNARLIRVASVLGGVLLLAAVVLGALALGSHRFYAVQTGSMSPSIPTRTLVVVEVGRYQIGQPITFVHDGGLITHRLVGANPDGTLITKGDANEKVDASSVKPAQVIGGVVATPQQVGYWWVYLTSPLGFASVVVGLALMYEIWVLFGTHDDGAETFRPRHLLTT